MSALMASSSAGSAGAPCLGGGLGGNRRGPLRRNAEVTSGQAKTGWPWGARMEPSEPLTPGQTAQWLILVARNQLALYAHLRRAYAGDDKVEVLLDRRRDESRNPPAIADRLRHLGAAVIRKRVESTR